jgi:TonB family protein
VKFQRLRPLGSAAVLFFSIIFAQSSVVRAASWLRSPAGSEQNPEMDLLASRVLEKLKKANIKTVAVSRFSEGKKFGHRPLSAELSDTFTSSLASIAGDIHIFDRTRISQASLQKKWISIDTEDSLVFRSVAFASGAEAVIQGTFKLDGKFVELSLKVVNSATDKKITEVKAKVLAPQVQEASPDAPLQDPVTGVYQSGIGGVTAPTCTYCPNPEFSSEARQKNIREAKNVFRITVRSDGRPADIRLVQPAGYGLDENSAAALQHWKFSPARLPNGTPVSSRVNVEIAFHL